MGKGMQAGEKGDKADKKQDCKEKAETAFANGR